MSPSKRAYLDAVKSTQNIGEIALAIRALHTQGLAQDIVRGDVPETLKDKQLYTLDLGSLVAGLGPVIGLPQPLRDPGRKRPRLMTGAFCYSGLPFVQFTCWPNSGTVEMAILAEPSVNSRV